MKKVGFEYRKGGTGNETPFEIFLKYTDEKEKSSAVLGNILSRLLVREDMTCLDIGSGNSEYLRSALNKVRNLKELIITLLEPSVDFARQLRRTAKLFLRSTSVSIAHSSFEDFTTDERFDIVLASHVPLAKDDLVRLSAIYVRMLDLLKPNGVLVVVLRGKDDIHQFRTKFKSLIMGKNYKSLTIGDAERVFRRIAKRLPLQLGKLNAGARLRLPYPDNMRDVITVAEFLLNKRWEEIPADIRDSVLAHVRGKHGQLQQIDGFLWSGIFDKVSSSVVVNILHFWQIENQLVMAGFFVARTEKIC